MSCSSAQHSPQKLPGMTRFARGHFLRRARHHDSATARATFGTEIDHPVGRFDDVQIVLDHEHRIVLIDEPIQHGKQPPDVVAVQSGRRFIENVERVAGAAGRPSSVANLIRWASPPERVVEGWPSVR